MSCTRPLAYNADTTSSPIVVTLTDIFDLKELQQIQDSFAVATGVASIITQPDGVPITTPSNFTRLCNDIIRKTGKGCANCYKSDALLGRYNPE
ncbi:MAG: PocR ligand-binding domain-containing protein, partial [Proteobacteria bacterium]|nr:PocR ligand-binding domain-containing protein [Pseudomonadota bacterium]